MTAPPAHLPRLRAVTDARALRLAIKALRQVRQRVAFDANLYERGLADSPTVREVITGLPGLESAWREYTLAGQAIERLEAML